MEKYVVTGLNAAYWELCAPSWLGSLKSVASYQGNVIVIDMGDLTETHKSRLQNFGVEVVKVAEGYPHYQLNQFQTIKEISRQRPGFYAYWAPDCYFQEAIDDVFNLDGLSVCINNSNAVSSVPGYIEAATFRSKYYRNILQSVVDKHGGLADCGFIGGHDSAWAEFMDFCRYAVVNDLVAMADDTDSLLLNTYASFFPGIARICPQIWNSKVNPTMRWREGGYAIGGVTVKVIQPGLESFRYFDLKEYSFQQCQKTIHRDWYGALVRGYIPTPKISSRRMVFREKPRVNVGERPEGTVEETGI